MIQRLDINAPHAIDLVLRDLLAGPGDMHDAGVVDDDVERAEGVQALREGGVPVRSFGYVADEDGAGAAAG